jgi:hypothetical protein
VRFSPKCHPEIAGAGIEYVWAVAKGWLRILIPLKNRKGREDFDNKAFADCFSTEQLNKTIIRGWMHLKIKTMVAYTTVYAEQFQKDNPGSPIPLDSLIQSTDRILYNKIMNGKKAYKFHHSVTNINIKDVKSIMQKTS